MPNCSIVADSTSSSAIHLQGSASIIADTLVTAGGVDTTGNPSFTLNKPAQTHAPKVLDPYDPQNCTGAVAICVGFCLAQSPIERG
jgi:hypothetical protein